jgi:hypothetical protein
MFFPSTQKNTALEPKKYLDIKPDTIKSRNDILVL